MPPLFRTQHTQKKLGFWARILHRLTPTIGLSRVGNHLGSMKGPLQLKVSREGLELQGDILPNSRALGKRLSRQGVDSLDISRPYQDQIKAYFRAVVKSGPDNPRLIKQELKAFGITTKYFSRKDVAYLRKNIEQVRWLQEITDLHFFGHDIFPELRSVVELINTHGRESFEEAAGLCSLPLRGRYLFRDGLFRFDLPKLKKVIDRYGMEPFLKIARIDRGTQPHYATRVFGSLADITNLIETYGINVFVEQAKILGPQRTRRVIGMLRHLEHLINSEQDLIEVCGILKQIGEKSVENAGEVLDDFDNASGLRPLKDKLKTKDDLRNYGLELARIAHLRHGRAVISRGIYNFTGLITSPEELGDVGDNLSEIAVHAENTGTLPDGNNAAQYLFMYTVADAIPIIERECFGWHAIIELAENGLISWCKTLANIQDFIRPGDDLCEIAAELGKLRGGYDYADAQRFIGYMFDLKEALLPLIKQYGLMPFIEIAKCKQGFTVLWKNDERNIVCVIPLINRYGIDTFVKIVRHQQKNSRAAFHALTNMNDLIERIGIQPFVELAGREGINWGRLAAISEHILNEEELFEIAERIPKMSYYYEYFIGRFNGIKGRLSPFIKRDGFLPVIEIAQVSYSDRHFGDLFADNLGFSKAVGFIDRYGLKAAAEIAKASREDTPRVFAQLGDKDVQAVFDNFGIELSLEIVKTAGRFDPIQLLAKSPSARDFLDSHGKDIFLASLEAGALTDEHAISAADQLISKYGEEIISKTLEAGGPGSFKTLARLTYLAHTEAEVLEFAGAIASNSVGEVLVSRLQRTTVINEMRGLLKAIETFGAKYTKDVALLLNDPATPGELVDDILAIANEHIKAQWGNFLGKRSPEELPGLLRFCATVMADKAVQTAERIRRVAEKTKKPTLTVYILSTAFKLNAEESLHDRYLGNEELREAAFNWICEEVWNDKLTLSPEAIGAARRATGKERAELQTHLILEAFDQEASKIEGDDETPLVYDLCGGGIPSGEEKVPLARMHAARRWIDAGILDHYTYPIGIKIKSNDKPTETTASKLEALSGIASKNNFDIIFVDHSTVREKKLRTERDPEDFEKGRAIARSLELMGGGEKHWVYSESEWDVESLRLSSGRSNFIGLNIYDGIVYDSHVGGLKSEWLPIDDNEQFVGVSWTEDRMNRNEYMVITRLGEHNYRVFSTWQVFSEMFDARVRKIRGENPDPRLLDRIAHKKILFLCHGNHDRSPLAEMMFRNILERRLGTAASEVSVSSAGIGMMEWYDRFAKEHKHPLAPSPGTQKLLKQKGIPFAEFRKTQLNPKMLDDAEIIFVMTENQRRMVLAQNPEAAGKVYLMREYAGYPEELWNIKTPTEFTYRVSYEFETTLERIFNRLMGEEAEEPLPVPVEIELPRFRLEEMG